MFTETLINGRSGTNSISTIWWMDKQHVVRPYNEILFGTTDTCYNMDEPETHWAKWKKLALQTPHVVHDSIYEMCRTGKSIDRNLGEVGKDSDHKWPWGFLGAQDENVLELGSNDGFTSLLIYQKPLNTLKNKYYDTEIKCLFKKLTKKKDKACLLESLPSPFQKNNCGRQV